MIKYKKTKADSDRERLDLERSPVMRFLKHQDHFKFNVGDILIKQTKQYIYGKNAQLMDDEDLWKTETITGVSAPKKFVYVFENELGIGYLKQLRVDGSGFTSQLICTVNFDPANTRFKLDPDFVDHMLVGEEDFQYNTEYLTKKAFRNEAIKKNTKLLVNTRSAKQRHKWYDGLKPGDVFWWGDTFDDLITDKYEVVNVKDLPLDACPSHVRQDLGEGLRYMSHYRIVEAMAIKSGNIQTLTVNHFVWRKVTMTEPYPMEDTLCGRRR